jgi:hypothetical protein
MDVARAETAQLLLEEGAGCWRRDPRSRDRSLG